MWGKENEERKEISLLQANVAEKKTERRGERRVSQSDNENLSYHF